MWRVFIFPCLFYLFAPTFAYLFSQETERPPTIFTTSSWSYSFSNHELLVPTPLTIHLAPKCIYKYNRYMIWFEFALITGSSPMGLIEVVPALHIQNFIFLRATCIFLKRKTWWFFQTFFQIQISFRATFEIIFGKISGELIMFLWFISFD